MEIEADRIKIVFIDWYKTLCSSIFFKSNEDENLCKKFRKRTFVDNVDLIEPWIEGKIGKETILQKIANNPDEYAKAEELLTKSCQLMQMDSQNFLPLIQKIRQKGVKVAIATDNMDIFTDYVVPALNLTNYFDEIISSSDIGCTKKDVKENKLLFFHDYLKKYNCHYEDAIMFDDIYETIELCKKHGMQGKCIKSPQDLEQALEKIAKEA